MKTNFLVLAVVMVTLLISSCKKDDNPGPDEIFMENLQFSPSSVTVLAGTTITWTNKESTIHTVTSNNGTFDSGDLGQSGTFSFTFSTAGTFSYHCIHHAGMTGTIIVQ